MLDTAESVTVAEAPTPQRVAAALALYHQVLELYQAGAAFALLTLTDGEPVHVRRFSSHLYHRCDKCGGLTWVTVAHRGHQRAPRPAPGPQPQVTTPAEHSRRGCELEASAEMLLVQGRTDEARSLFAAAYLELSMDAQLIADEPERLARIKALGFGRY